ncbi:MAG: NAD(P)H-hydrate dehydratase [Gemmatimonadaceae bacterium]|jgi:NAD(P)H-hydrate epimerase|nr:NAD(P)H-hydrate dehydratase [Gemmatimonadaceae bacterium]
MSAVVVTTAAQAAARDRAAITAGTPSFTLMQAAARAAVARLEAHGVLTLGPVAVWVGPGNNGGDGWLVAALLRARGLDVRVGAVGEPRTEDARRARTLATGGGVFVAPSGEERLHVDALLGTGQRVPLPDDIARATARVRAARERGARVVALDVPTGVADGADGAPVARDPQAIVADLTICFGTLKRALLAAREQAGTIDVVDIGLGAHAEQPDDAPLLMDPQRAWRGVPPIGARAHKGTRGRLAIIGGTAGMVGAVILAARAALASGIGLVRCVVDRAHVGDVHAALPEALVSPWPRDGTTLAAHITELADALVVGPGLGPGEQARALVESVLATERPVLVDAEALRHLPTLAHAAANRAHASVTVLTPHPGEALPLLDDAGAARWPTAAAIDAARDAVADHLSARWHATVLLKGVPTIVASTAGRVAVARGTAALATGGSGDVLSGIGGTLLAQAVAPLEAAAIAAWVHGVAAEQATARRGGVRGTTLADVLAALSDAWPRHAEALPPELLATLPAVPA